MPDPLLKLHDKGVDVIEAQGLLNRNGAILDPDGDFGKGTETAVREFQAAAGLPAQRHHRRRHVAASARACPSPLPTFPPAPSLSSPARRWAAADSTTPSASAPHGPGAPAA